MAIYDVYGNPLTECFSVDGSQLERAYDVNGNVIYEASEPIDPMDRYLENRILVFEDNFTGDSLDTDKWECEIGYCRNDELQHYRPENAIVANGLLNLKAIREHYAGDITRNSTWTSASITTNNRFEAFYGRYQAKIKFPCLVGSFPAFWLLGEGLDFQYYDDGTRCTRKGGFSAYPQCGEIDIDEQIPGNATTAQSNLWKYNSGSLTARSGTIDPTEWHIYEMEWTASAITMMVDGVAFKTYDLSSDDWKAYRLPSPTGQNGFYTMLDHAVGASGGTPAISTMEMNMYVDWVRIYAPVGYTQSQINAESISIDNTMILSVGETGNLEVTWNPVLTFDRTTKWSSSNESVATVASGRVKAIGTGTAVITVETNNGKTATCTVTVS